jgi:hypothetical protein
MSERILEQGMSASQFSADLWEQIAREAFHGIASQTRFPDGTIFLLGTANKATTGPAVGFTEEAMAAIAQRASERLQEIARAFAVRISESQDVNEVWLMEDSPTLIVALVVNEISLDRELELRAAFADLTVQHDTQLKIYAAAGDRADFARRGTKLLG